MGSIYCSDVVLPSISSSLLSTLLLVGREVSHKPCVLDISYLNFHLRAD